MRRGRARRAGDSCAHRDANSALLRRFFRPLQGGCLIFSQGIFLSGAFQRASLAVTLLGAIVTGDLFAAPWGFTDVSEQAGVQFEYGLATDTGEDQLGIIGGVAASDFDGDGWTDLYVVTGLGAPNRLLRNMGDGTFQDVAPTTGVAGAGFNDSGPLFADLDSDGWPDLFIGGLSGDAPHLFRNLGNGTFEEVTDRTDWPDDIDWISAAAGDFDGDGLLDLVTAHWERPDFIYVWHNNGGFNFSDVSAAVGLRDPAVRPFGFSPAFTDLDGDGLPDLIYVADFGTTEYFLNDGDGHFTRMTGPVISDDNGMGLAIGDYDNDGHLDWFVSSISHEPDTRLQFTGNRLYRNLGNGTFEDTTDQAGVRRGYWGWGACFADFDNDGWLDLFHVNGFDVFPEPVWATDPSRLFMNEGNGTFTERAFDMGIEDRRSGRGVVCFDYDGDGDVDIFTGNRNAPHRLYRNDGGNAQGGFLQLQLVDIESAPHAGNAVVRVTTGQGTQMREVRFGSNFVSNDPPVLHFGLGTAPLGGIVEITWPDGEVQNLGTLAANQSLRIVRGARSHIMAHTVPTGGLASLVLLAVVILGTALGFQIAAGRPD